MDGAYWGGAGAGNIVRQTGIDGWEMRCAWENLESTLGTYTFTALNANIAKVTGWGKKVAISLNTTGYYPGYTHSRAPAYITSNHTTYGGLPGSGGELQCKPIYGSQFNIVNMWNTNTFNRFKALIDALATQYDGVIEYIIYDEMATQLTDEEATAVGGISAIAAKQLEIYDYMKSKFLNSTVFVKMNYLSGVGDTRGAVISNLNAHKNNGKTGAVELAFPLSNPLYPNFTPSISNGHLENTHAVLREFPFSQRRYAHTEASESSTLADTTSAIQNRQALRWAAYMFQGCEKPIFRITINDGIGGGPGASNYGLQWAALSPYLTSRYLR